MFRILVEFFWVSCLGGGLGLEGFEAGGCSHPKLDSNRDTNSGEKMAHEQENKIKSRVI